MCAPEQLVYVNPQQSGISEFHFALNIIYIIILYSVLPRSTPGAGIGVNYFKYILYYIIIKHYINYIIVCAPDTRVPSYKN
jgi:hypothetical protein